MPRRGGGGPALVARRPGGPPPVHPGRAGGGERRRGRLRPSAIPTRLLPFEEVISASLCFDLSLPRLGTPLHATLAPCQFDGSLCTWRIGDPDGTLGHKREREQLDISLDKPITNAQLPAEIIRTYAKRVSTETCCNLRRTSTCLTPMTSFTVSGKETWIHHSHARKESEE
ncbi:uncharacterized protein LOC115336468 isoform X3 [Aquila chrysaetos chrysaetos]|uniref:uncharacterized protein LOC115336468 isoform X3 n=1 Tax=Aquila chrysaetos chrysaetos TaxID=223781 RepID=UPI001176A062|nr:uncharacterized protein LOC115336468 isoform X3 [Aquila chrysaetos chrysaetos]